MVDLSVVFLGEGAPDPAIQREEALRLAGRVDESARRVLVERGFAISGETIRVGVAGAASTVGPAESGEYARAVSHVPTAFSRPPILRPFGPGWRHLTVGDQPSVPGAWWDPARARDVDSIIVIRTSIVVETPSHLRKRTAYNLTGGLLFTAAAGIPTLGLPVFDFFARSPAWVEHRMVIQSARTGEVLWENSEQVQASPLGSADALERSVRNLVSWIGPV